MKPTVSESRTRPQSSRRHCVRLLREMIRGDDVQPRHRDSSSQPRHQGNGASTTGAESGSPTPSASIRDLPHHLIASFKATLEEVAAGPATLARGDASNPHAEEQILAVNGSSPSWSADKKPMLLVLTKVDRLADSSFLHVFRSIIRARWRPLPRRARDWIRSRTRSSRCSAPISLTSRWLPAPANGRVFAYLSTHADVYRQQYVATGGGWAATCRGT